jgi:starch synthase
VNILFLSSEAAPFAKAGGLADISSALPRHLHERGHDVRLFLPMYARVQKEGRTFDTVVREASIQIGPHRLVFSVHSTLLPGTSLRVYFIRCPTLFDRPSLYTQDPDEHIRFTALSWAALVACQHMGFAPDVVHVNDWQTALVPLILKRAFSWDRLFDRARTVLTIHNIGHQGAFDARVLAETGLAGAVSDFHQDQLREGRVNFLLTGILYANAITTVSPTYAREIQTPAHGVGLDAFLRERNDVFFGILNGIDEAEWSPERDGHLAKRYSAQDLGGKEACKGALLRAAGLPYREDVPVIGVVSRLVWQKGFDLCETVLPVLLRRRAFQLIALGTGEPRYEELFRRLSREFPRQVAYRGGFSEPLAHHIEAGSDLFLMPSRYEPCGLNQMYSLRYGTPPIVHRTGGLADTVRPFDTRSAQGTGFVFDHFDETGLAWAIQRALDVWGDGRGEQRARWRRLQQNGMSLPLGWDHRVGEYVALYERLAPGAA